MNNVLLAVDYHYTLASKVTQPNVSGDWVNEFTVKDHVVNAIDKFINAGNEFAIVTSGARRHVESIIGRIRGAYFALENGLVILTPSGLRINTAPTNWLSIVASIKRELMENGVKYSEGEVSLFTSESELVRSIAAKYNVKVEPNRGTLALMPSGIDKGYAIRMLRRLIKPSAVVAIGDGENDAPMLKMADVAVAVDNALPEIKSIAHYVTKGVDGDGVVEVIELILSCNGELVKCLTPVG
ncbi:HAD family hydrolase [Caldivirga maquilingensis]|uniref:Haloacid dehalogenase domain protein hydrolase type 3 n=1 Tax=Caldivirga maquilingensis (strain ATCC 700844 / DSM 13496 / JCM 10307 / IC-167) TaxID=397948 RepID=A8MAR9_CALMQ|nr:HAD hydrolase family protein [Caldivirga maquilingensis]ABW01105.1 Haloacid dehalogenase domain protein hydrolase type 3 [Caldivirga maquilingensis IC-167]